MITLTSEIEERLTRALAYCYSVPFIDDVEDFVWEAIWSYGIDIDAPDPLNRSKRLFDVTDTSRRVGWSAKTLVWKFETSKECEFVIQRADVFKKAKDLGFQPLDENSDPQTIGDAVLEHWTRKVQEDMTVQGVDDPRVSILLKNLVAKEFEVRLKWAVLEEALVLPKRDEISWSWTNSERLGLQGTRKSDGFVLFRWYRNQKQLFERMKFPTGLVVREIPLTRKTAEEILGS
jgi:hypothetical protein